MKICDWVEEIVLISDCSNICGEHATKDNSYKQEMNIVY